MHLVTLNAIALYALIFIPANLIYIDTHNKRLSRFKFTAFYDTHSAYSTECFPKTSSAPHVSFLSII